MDDTKRSYLALLRVMQCSTYCQKASSEPQGLHASIRVKPQGLSNILRYVQLTSQKAPLRRKRKRVNHRKASGNLSTAHTQAPKPELQIKKSSLSTKAVYAEIKASMAKHGKLVSTTYTCVFSYKTGSTTQSS